MIKKLTSIPLKLNELLDKKRKLFLIILFFMAIFLSFIETAGVSVIMPFITVASNPELADAGYYKYFYDLFKFSDTTGFIITFGIVIIAFYVFRAVYNTVYNYSLNKFSYGTYRLFASKLFKTYIAIPYKLFVQKNPSVMSQTIVTEARNLSALILDVLQALSESFTVMLLYFFMLLVNWQITLVLTSIIAFIFYIVFVSLIKKSKQLGKKRYAANSQLSKTLWETFSNFKFIKLKGNEDEIYRVFSDSTSKMSHTMILSSTLGAVPKSILENLGFSLLIAAVCYILWHYKTAAMVIPVVSMYALALYRMLPAINKILSYLNGIAFNQRSLNKVYDELKLETDTEGSNHLDFTKSIRGENLCFSYLTGGEVIKNVSFNINIGERVAFTGESGSGKTTLVDIIIGIYKPLQGSLFVDDSVINNDNIRSWRRRIGYIPQDIFLFDGSVAENVAFGSNTDENQIINVLKKAKIWDFFETREGINTWVGEGGIQLSGGQKQRIGIARALFNDPEVLVLDEATSSLDDDTEAKIMDEIYDVSGSKTLIIVAHRLSTVDRCDRRIRIENGEIVSC